MINPKSLNRETIHEWLDRCHDGDRAWLAEKIGHTAGSVAHMFSKRGFSSSALAVIAALMELDERGPAAEEDAAQLIVFSALEFEEIEDARARVGHPPRPQFYRDAVLNYVEEIKARKKKGKKR